jgi:hypothetical protein
MTASIVLRSARGEDEEVVMRVVFVHGACVKDGSWWTARQSLAVLEQPVHSAAWQHLPSTYLV